MSYRIADIKKLANKFNEDNTYAENLRNIESLRNSFVEYYTIDKIRDLKLEEYVCGRKKAKYNDYRTFCYRIEYELNVLGSMKGSYASKFGIYWNTSLNDYECNPKYGTSKDEVFSNVKASIISLLEYAKKENLQKIEESKIANAFKYKLIATYYPDRYLPISSLDHIEEFLKKLNIPFNKKDLFITKQEKLRTFKDKIPQMKDWNLYKYMSFLYQVIKTDIAANNELDHELINKINSQKLSDKDIDETKIKEPKQVFVKGSLTFARSPQVSSYALKKANHMCEIDNGHASFIRRNDGLRYTEPHHLIPMSMQDEFNPINLDIPENIVSLCSNCHNEIHYGKNANSLIKKLYEMRKDALSAKGINISLKELLSFYRKNGGNT